MKKSLVAVLTPFLLSTAPHAQQPGESPALGNNRITQNDITGGALSLFDIRLAGMKIFSTPFNSLDGYGDGPGVNPLDPVSPGDRPTLQNNGTFLRINGLDAQTCMECHSVGSNATVPFRFAVGGVGGVNNNAMFQPDEIDVDDELGNGFAFYNGRFINPPFLFGSGGVELAGKEMTMDLQNQKAQAQSNPGVSVALVTKGVSFGSITYDGGSGTFDTSQVAGVDADLVVRPFGRKGEFATVRGFDLGAMAFHLGMEPVEVVGAGVDGDNDGVTDEILIGEISALHVFNTNLERPKAERPKGSAKTGKALFSQVGCTSCHQPFLNTTTQYLTYSFPEVDEDPTANVFYATDLRKGPAGFRRNMLGGVSVPLFSDLKRHDMGAALAESFGSPLDSFFITARLWGIADTAPYLHDGRALTLTDAILMHGGEGATASANFQSLADTQKEDLLSYLRTLRTPEEPAEDLLP